MAAQILDGKSLAASIRAGLKERVAALVQRGVRPGLAVVLAGDDAASRVYVRNKTLAAAEIGVHSELHEFKTDATEKTILQQIHALNENPRVHSILVQLPLPKHIDSARVLEAVAPQKDVDGFHEVNLGALVAGRPGVVPCTPAGVMELLRHEGVELEGVEAVVVGRSKLVGVPVARLLLAANATVTVCHSRTRDLNEACSRADVLIAAVGAPRLLGADAIKPGATVIDVGVNRTDDGLCGDVDFEAAVEVAGAITPVPGGVGPMTIAMLLVNTLAAARAGHS
jgi:methylenetetrahydrofolate dehydrogenase (NADP+)/methenyltetrahydrofolate cyclohydrolase